VQHCVLTFAGITGAIFLLGGMRIAFASERSTVRVAGIGWPKGIIEAEEFMRAVMPDMTPAEHEKLNQAFMRIQQSFLARSEREARAGARVIVWPEANLIVFRDEESAFIERARALAREHRVYLLMGMATLSPGERYTFRNHALLLNPEGETAYDYTKTTAVPGFEKRYGQPGCAPIPFADTEFGRIASPICFDMDFDAIIHQVGRGNADLMLNPASDWKEIMPLHQQMAEFRAVENGTALFRITRWGGSGAVDPYGRRLAWMDDFGAADNVMVAQVPVKAGVRTLYARVGNMFAWVCVTGLASGVFLYVLDVLVGRH
jgi:apolipoprotein N-acyltransferase